MEKTDQDGALWEPWIPRMCIGCIHRALANSNIPQKVTDTTDKVCAELGIDPDDDGVDRDHEFGINLVNDTTRIAIEEMGIDLGEKGAYPTLRIEAEFDCPVETYRLTASERGILSEMLVPDVEYRANGRDDVMTRYFYNALREDRPEVFIAAIFAAKDFLDLDRHDSSSEEFNELKLNRLLAMVADMPVEVPIDIRQGIWEIILGAQWIHNNSETGALEHTLLRSHDNDPTLTLLLHDSSERAIQDRQAQVRQLTRDDEAIDLEGADSPNSTFVYVMSHHSMEAADAYQSLHVLQSTKEQIDRLLQQKRVH